MLGGKEKSFSISDGCLMYGERVLIPETLQKKLILGWYINNDGF